MSDIPKWWEGTPDLKDSKKSFDTIPKKRATSQEISEKLTLANKYYSEYVAKETAGNSDSEGRWIKGFLTKGTVGDKIASLSVVAQKDPICAGPSAISGLLTMAKKKNRSESKAAIDALKLLFTQVLIPPHRPLLYFFEQPVTDPRATKIHYIHWLFEDKVKKAFQEYVDIVENAAKDTVSTQKEFALFVAYDLLKFSRSLSLSSPRLIALLVNKLGDQSKQVCGKICTWLSDLVIKYPALKMPVTEEVERFLYRRNNSLRSQYYAVVFLSSLLLKQDRDKELATKLISVYLSFFRKATGSDDVSEIRDEKSKNKKNKKKKSEVEKQSEAALDSRLLSAIMTGIHRAFPYADPDSTTFSEHINTLFKIARTSTFNKSVQAFQLLFHFMSSNDSLSDRFYSAIYERILSPEALNTNKQSLFFNILFKSIRLDPSAARVAAIVKRLLQLCAYAPPPFATACLIMVSELMKEKPSLKAMAVHVDDDDDEHDDDDDEGGNGGSKGESQMMDLDETKNSKLTEAYKPLKRDPRYTNADKTCLWELYTLYLSYHPSVSKFAETILNGESINYAGDPLLNFTLVNFLDRFAFKNPKKRFTESKKEDEEGDKDEENEEEDDEGIDEGKMNIPGKVDKLRSSLVLPPINSDVSIKRKHIPEEEKFYQQYFNFKAQVDNMISQEEEAERLRKEMKKKKKGGGDLFDDDMKDFFDDDDIGKENEEDEDDEYAGFEEALEADAKDRTSVPDAGEDGGEDAFFNDDFDDDDGDDDDDEEAVIRRTLESEGGLFGGEDDDDDDVAGLEEDLVDEGDGNGIMGEDDDDEKLPDSFADVDEFSELLEENAVNPKQKEWEEGKRKSGGNGGGIKRKKSGGAAGAPKKKKGKK